jgi:uncharacterized protein YndB with AHSA1/START domain
VDPVTASITIGRPREEVFDYLADVANHPEFSDHYLKDFRLLRLDSYGRGAGARFRRDRRFRPLYEDFTFAEVERPYRIVAFGRGGKFNRIKTTTIFTLDEAGAGTRLEVMAESEPPLLTDKLMETVTGYRGWTKRNLRKALSRLQSILEGDEDRDRGPRATVAGVASLDSATR